MQILPLAGMFVLGVIARRLGLVQERLSSMLLQLVFYVILPVITFLAILLIPLDTGVVFLALFPPVVMSVTVIVGLVLRRSLLSRVRTKTFAAMLAGAAVTNQGFLVPFVDSTYGIAGLAQLAVINCFTVIMIFSLLYGIIALLGRGRQPDGKAIAAKVLSVPTPWAFVAGLVFRLSGGSLPDSVMALFPQIALLLALTMMLAVGIKFHPQMKHPPLFFLEVILRFLLGAAIGLCFVKALHLQGLGAQIILIASMAPTGLNSVTLAQVEKLDMDYAVSSAAYSLLIGLVVTPFAVRFVSMGVW